MPVMQVTSCKLYPVKKDWYILKETTPLNHCNTITRNVCLDPIAGQVCLHMVPGWCNG